jgi:DNA gyrase subunit A
MRIIEDEMKEAYMAYAMSVIVGRALPDVRDGLKPVHKRILYAMQEAGIRHNQSYKKCARIIGDVLGKYHPHGDSAVYDALVRMAQTFSLRYPLVDPQGNFGSIDGDPPAAYRYTEARLAKISQELLSDIDKDTVDWKENFDGSLKEPEVLPATLPNLLLNGSAGIAVGMATNIPPHNLQELADAIVHHIENPEATAADLMQYLPGPDFPTGGVIRGRSGIISAYSTGRGKITLRGVMQREQRGDRERLIITEIPYQVIKSDLIVQIADLVREKRIEGISDIRDESDRKGMRVVIELKRDASPDIVENLLLKHTRLQQTFGIINLAIVDKQPRVLTLPDMIGHYVGHRINVITRRTQHDLRKAQERAHILEGLLIALKNLDTVIPLIRKSADAEKARVGLIAGYDLTEAQANAILEMRLQRLTGLEQDKIKSEHTDLIKLITDLTDILDKPERVKNMIKDDLKRMAREYGDERRTAITDDEEDLDIEDLIEEEDMVVTISHESYIKRISADTYQAQKRGGVGIIGATTKEGDFVEHLFVANTHDYLLFFTSKGKVHWKKVYRIPESGRTARGTALVNLLQLDKDERISAVIPVREFGEDEYLVFATRQGHVKKTVLSEYSRPRQGGINAIKLEGEDDLVGVVRTSGRDELLLASRAGQAIRFSEGDVRSMGRVSRGVRGMRLRSADQVVSLSIVKDAMTILTATENGYGKRTKAAEYPLQGRGGYGVRNIKVSERNGFAVTVRVVADDDELLLITKNGQIIRTPAVGISSMGRATQGVRIMRLRQSDLLMAVAKVLQE